MQKGNLRSSPTIHGARAPKPVLHDPGLVEPEQDDALTLMTALQNAIFSSSNFSCIATDAQGVIRIFNIGAERLLGYTAADVASGITQADIFAPPQLIAPAAASSAELAAPILPGFDTLTSKVDQGIEDNFELTCIRKDGSRIPSIVSVTALRDEQSVIIGYLLIVTDNTARKQIEAEHKLFAQSLSDHQFYTRSLIESNIDAMIATDPSGTITDVNKQMETLTDRPREVLIGTLFKEYFTEPERARAGIELVLRDKKVVNYELTALAKNGKETMVSFNASIFCNPNGDLQGVFANVRDITERKQAEQQILNLAFQDSLTQLPNRRAFTERMQQALASSKRSNRHGALIFLDLDNFKSLNDTHGHGAGDLLLIEAARRIVGCIREVDFVARLGGDEFIALIGDMDTDRAVSATQANVVADKLRAALDKPYQLKIVPEGKAETSITHHCTASIGVTLFLDHEITTEEIVRRADIAMYRAKEAGGNSIRFSEV